MRKLYEICYGTEPTDRELALLEIQYNRLIDNGFTDKEAQRLMIDNNLNTNDLCFLDSIIAPISNVIYFHNELQIHSKPGSYNPETGMIEKQPYYLEMKRRYTMDNLLNYYYEKLMVPSYFRNTKRDVGAFKHLIESYKFDNIQTVDFILFIIDYAVSKEIKISNPLELKNWAQQTYEYLETYIICYKPKVVYREEII